jgi:hypothetical protein
MGSYTTDREPLTEDQTKTDHQTPPNRLKTVLQGRRIYPEPSDDIRQIDVFQTRYLGIVQEDTSTIVHSLWAEDTRGQLPRHRIFARTADEVFLITHHKVLKRLLPLLAGNWEQAHQSLLINVPLVETWNDRAKRVAFVDHIDATGDAVDVSKRRWTAVKEALARCDRITKRSGGI